MQGDRQEPCRGDRLCGADKVVDDMRRFILFLEYVFGEFGMETIGGIIGGVIGALIIAVIAKAL